MWFFAVVGLDQITLLLAVPPGYGAGKNIDTACFPGSSRYSRQCQGILRRPKFEDCFQSDIAHAKRCEKGILGKPPVNPIPLDLVLEVGNSNSGCRSLLEPFILYNAAWWNDADPNTDQGRVIFSEFAAPCDGTEHLSQPCHAKFRCRVAADYKGFDRDFLRMHLNGVYFMTCSQGLILHFSAAQGSRRATAYCNTVGHMRNKYAMLRRQRIQMALNQAGGIQVRTNSRPYIPIPVAQAQPSIGNAGLSAPVDDDEIDDRPRDQPESSSRSQLSEDNHDSITAFLRSVCFDMPNEQGPGTSTRKKTVRYGTESCITIPSIISGFLQ